MFAFCAFSFFIVSKSVNAQQAKDQSEILKDASAQRIFEDSKKSVFQIQVVSVNSGEKTTIGSGFLFEKSNQVITNYHVISEAVLKPRQYRIEFVTSDGQRGQLSIDNINVIHDLALLNVKDEAGLSGIRPLRPSDESLYKGQRIFSIGNPHDLGMMITEGVYNGLLERSFYRRILFSGALNGGMSGGPSMNTKGQVIGVNVAAQGEDLGYLVPVGYAVELLSADQGDNAWLEQIGHQLKRNSSLVIDDILSKEWTIMKHGAFSVPYKFSSAFKCWAYDKIEDEQNNRNYNSSVCSSQDDIFISDDLETGKIIYEVANYSSTKMNAFAFSRYSQWQFADVFSNVTRQSTKEVKDFVCKSEFLELAQRRWKVSFCARPYEKYSDIYDVFFAAALLGEVNKGYVLKIYMEGFAKNNTQDFVLKFLEEIE